MLCSRFFTGVLLLVSLFHMLQMTLPFTVGVVVKLGVGVHALALAAPVALPLVDEPVVDLLQIQGTNSLQVLLLCLLNTKC